MTPKPLRCATYARYSSDQQREASINDQQRMMARFAECKGWQILPEYVFSDQAMSGAGADRPGIQALRSAALSKPKPFDVVLVDDSSRISRNLADAIRLREELSFAQVRLIAVSQGIDSDNEQADVMLTVHGLVDSLYIKELSKKTHRGLEGLALEGFHTGGNCFGFRNVKVGNRVRLEIDEHEAAIVNRIFEMSASGISLKRIAKTLNAEGIAPPRGSKHKVRPSWVYTAIREMLRRELYIGCVVWNKRKYIKKPGTNKRISVLRPENEWSVREDPSLRIVSQKLWHTVQANIKVRADLYSNANPGLMTRAASSPHLFSGILKCSECGSNLTILGTRGKNRRDAYYGCPGHLHRGICGNSVYERLDVIEDKLLSGIREKLLDSRALDYAMSKLQRGFEAHEEQEQVAQCLRKQVDIEKELHRLADAIAKNGGSNFLLQMLNKKEVELENLKKTVTKLSQMNVSIDSKWLRKRLAEELTALPTLLKLEPERAKAHLLRHVTEVRMTPVVEDGRKFYVAEGEWLIGENEKITGAKLDGDPRLLRSIAGAGFEPATFGL